MASGPDRTDTGLPIWDQYQNVISVALIVAMALAGLVFALRRPPPTTITIIPPDPTPTPAPTLPPTQTPEPGPIQVYVTGAVSQPDQVVTLPFGSRVADAIAAAGGMTSVADPARTNLAGRLRDGDQVHVFAIDTEGSSSGEVVLATPENNGIVYVNTADSEELQRLPGIGPALAERIVAYRDEHGNFGVIEDLDAVNGIGPATLAEIEPHISFEVR